MEEDRLGGPVAQWLEHPMEAVGLIPAQDTDFFSVAPSPVAKQLAYYFCNY